MAIRRRSLGSTSDDYGYIDSVLSGLRKEDDEKRKRQERLARAKEAIDRRTRESIEATRPTFGRVAGDVARDVVPTFRQGANWLVGNVAQLGPESAQLLERGARSDNPIAETVMGTRFLSDEQKDIIGNFWRREAVRSQKVADRFKYLKEADTGEDALKEFEKKYEWVYKNAIEEFDSLDDKKKQEVALDASQKQPKTVLGKKLRIYNIESQILEDYLRDKPVRMDKYALSNTATRIGQQMAVLVATGEISAAIAPAGGTGTLAGAIQRSAITGGLNVLEGQAIYAGRDEEFFDRKGTAVLDFVIGSAFPAADEALTAVRKTKEGIELPIFRKAVKKIITDDNAKNRMIKRLISEGVIDDNDAKALKNIARADELEDALKSIETRQIQGPTTPTKITQEPVFGKKPVKVDVEALTKEAESIRATIGSDYLASLPPEIANSKFASLNKRLSEIDSLISGKAKTTPITPKVSQIKTDTGVTKITARSQSGVYSQIKKAATEARNNGNDRLSERLSKLADDVKFDNQYEFFGSKGYKTKFDKIMSESLSQPTGAKEIVGYKTTVEPRQAAFTMSKTDVSKARQKLAQFLGTDTDATKVHKATSALVELAEQGDGRKASFVSKLLSKFAPTRVMAGRGEEMIRAMSNKNTKAGRVIADLMGINEFSKAKIYNSLEGSTKTIKKAFSNKLGKTDVKKVAKWKKLILDTPTNMRGSIDEIMLKAGYSEDVAKASKKIVEALDNRRDIISSITGKEIGFIEGYFPEVFDPAQESAFKSWLKSQGYTPKDEWDVYEIYDNMPRELRSGIEQGRTKIPDRFRVSDPLQALAQWNKDTARRIAELETYGNKFERLDKYYQEIAENFGDGQTQFIKDLLKLQRFGTPKSAATVPASVVRDMIVITKMPLSTIANAAQTINSASVSPRFAAKALKNTLKNWNGATEKALKHGVNLTEVSDYLVEQLYKAKASRPTAAAAEWMLKINMFKSVEKFNRLYSSELGELTVKNWARNPLKRGNKARLLKIGLNPEQIAKNGLSDDMLSMGVRNFVGETQFFVTPKDLPKFASSSELGRTVTHLGSFSMKQMQFYKDWMAKEAIRGNIVPFITFLGLSQAVGAPLGALRNLITGSKNEVGTGEIPGLIENKDYDGILTWVGQNLQRAGGKGYVFESLDSLEYGNTWYEKAMKSGGPAFGELANLIAIAEEDDPWRKEEKWNKWWRKQIPFVGQRLKNEKYPYDPKSAEFWDIIDEFSNEPGLQLSSIRTEDVEEITKLKREGGDLSNSSFAGALISKLNTLRGKQEDEEFDYSEQIKKVEDTIKKLGISEDVAGSYSEKYKDNKSSLKDEMSKEELALLKESKAFVYKYLKNNKKKLEDYPKLKEYTEKYGWQ